MTILGSNPRARVNVNAPEAFAICDRCGFLRNLSDLAAQQQYRGDALMPTGYLVCHDTCLDVPHQFNRPIFLPPDPQPVPNPRPNFWAQETAGTSAPPQTLPGVQTAEDSD